MNDINTAKREARRRAKDGGSLQGHLDAVAREAGCRHWGDFLANPAPVAENILDRLVREAHEDGYDGLEIDIGEHVPAPLGPALVKAFRGDGDQLLIKVFKLGWDDASHLAPAIRKRFEDPRDNACRRVDCGGRDVFLYNHLDVNMAFHFTWMGAGWTEMHGMEPEEALRRAGRLSGWWRGREGRSLEAVIADRELHRRHVRKLRRIVDAPSCPPVRYDPFCSSVVPSETIHPDLARAHFQAVAEIVVPDGPDAHEQRVLFAEIALRMKGRIVPCEWGSRTVGLPDFSTLATTVWKEMLRDGLPSMLHAESPSRLTSVLNQLATKMIRFARGPMAQATDGVGLKYREEKAWVLWEQDMIKAFMQEHPGIYASGPQFDEWMSKAEAQPGVPPRRTGYHHG